MSRKRQSKNMKHRYWKRVICKLRKRQVEAVARVTSVTITIDDRDIVLGPGVLYRRGDQ